MGPWMPTDIDHEGAPTIAPPVKLSEPYYKVWPVDRAAYNTFCEIGGEFRGGEIVDGICDGWAGRNQLLIVTYHE